MRPFHLATLVLALVLLLHPSARADVDDVSEPDAGPSVAHRIITYLPNRLLDVLDVVRMRVRVGPGAAVSVRATEAADVFVGSYWTLYAGLPGPRGRKLPRLPVGIENRSGIEVSAADLTGGLGFAPDYSATELGLGFQALLIGIDVGLDPVEVLDLLGGFLFWDPRKDDL